MNTKQDYYYALSKANLITPANRNIPLLSFVARSGTGKTTYLEQLIGILKQEGLKIAVLKHDAHQFEIDRPGKDSYRFTQAGADHVILTSRNKTACVIRHEDTVPLHDLISYIGDVDLIITEGYKHENQPKIELLRKGYHETPVSDPKQLIAIVADFDYQTTLPLFDLNRPSEIVPFLHSFLVTVQNQNSYDRKPIRNQLR
jgi:molybdopterin-guanine dinucleotide biosynthesis protein MobB